MINKPKTIDSVATEFKAAEAQTVEKTIEGVKQASSHAQTTMKDGVGRAMKTAEQLAQFSQGNVEAVMKSSQILASGLRDMSKLFAEHAKASLDETMATFKAMTSVKSVKEVFDMQTSFARSAMEKAVAESGKLTEHSMKLAEQAFAPLTARVNVAVETFTAQH